MSSEMKKVATKLQCTLRILQLHTPIGPVTITGCDAGIHEIKLTASDTAPSGNLRSVNIDGEERKSELPEPLRKCLDWLEIFFKDASGVASIPLPPLHMTSIKPGTFISKVLHTLAHDIHAGDTISYGGLAAKVGNPNASRAVGTAMRMNKVPLVVPCHRVIKSDGSLGNYMSGKGVALKQWLLDHESATVKIKR